MHGACLCTCWHASRRKTHSTTLRNRLRTDANLVGALAGTKSQACSTGARFFYFVFDFFVIVMSHGDLAGPSEAPHVRRQAVLQHKASCAVLYTSMGVAAR